MHAHMCMPTRTGTRADIGIGLHQPQLSRMCGPLASPIAPSAHSLAPPVCSCNGNAASSGLLVPTQADSLESRLLMIERALAPASALELRLSSVERTARANAKSRPQETWGKLWAALNRLDYRLHVLASPCPASPCPPSPRLPSPPLN